MLKQKLQFKTKTRLVALVLVLILVLAALPTRGFGVFAASCATVSDCQAQINNLSNQNAANQASLSALEAQAGSYQAAIASLQQQVAGLQAQISDNENQQAQAQAELTQEKKTLGENIRAMYLEGDISTLEILASSNNLSTYVNRQQYRNAVSDKVKTSVDKITTLQAQLVQLHSSLTRQQEQLAATEAEQSRLLNLNESQQSAFNSQIASNNSAISQLRAQIVALNTPPSSHFTYSGSCGGSYPAAAGPGLWGGTWGCNYSQDNTIDNWGMFNRECVSYTAWMVHEEYVSGQISHDMPNWGGVGNAYQWITDAQNAGIPVDQSPQPGDIAIRPASGIYGDVGHAMYVASVSGGQIYVQQYNADLRGNYSEGWRSASGLYFLHFAQW